MDAEVWGFREGGTGEWRGGDIESRSLAQGPLERIKLTN